MATKVETPTSPWLSLNNYESYFLLLSHKLATTSTTKGMEMTGQMMTTTMRKMLREEMNATTSIGLDARTRIQGRGRKDTIGMSWDDFKALLMEEYCPNNEMQKLENELWNHTMIGAGHAAYTDRFHELAKIVPHLVTPKSKRIDRYIHGLVSKIRGMVRATEPSTIQSAILRAGALTDDAVRDKWLSKRRDKRKGMSESSKQVDTRADNKKAKWGKGFVANNPGRNGYKGNHPKYAKCDGYHQEFVLCRACFNYNRIGHYAKDCQTVSIRASPVNAVNPRACYECGSPDHFHNTCPRLNYSFVSTNLLPLLDVKPNDLEFSYAIEMANGRNKETNKIIYGCTLVSEVREERPEKDLKRLLSMKTDEKNLEDIPIVCRFCEVFPEYLSGSPPVQEVEFQIELILGATLVAKSVNIRHIIRLTKSPYRLAPSEMRELSNQLQELQDKGFIRPIHSPWGAHEVHFLGHMVNRNGIHVDPSKIGLVKNWKTPKTPTEFGLFLELAGCYRRFIANFSRIAKPLTLLTKKDKKFEWGDEQEEDF
ncbi:putative reverse transcriptase domain-containing protein [Tanacetum coccineum]